MIRVRFPAPKANETSLLVTGHSESAEKGSDIICSAVSTLVLTYLGGVEKTLDAKIDGQVSSGICDVTVTVPTEHQQMFVKVSEVFRYGFERLARQYPTFMLIERNL